MAVTRTIRLDTAVPGPRSREVLDRLAASVASPLAITFPVVAAEAHGVTITDVDGNVFIDFAGGVGCLNVGHSHPHVVAATQEQLEKFSHTDFTVVPYEVYAELSERLLALAPFSGPAKAGVLQCRRRGRRECRQVCARVHRASRGDRIRGRVPRPDDALACADLEDPSLQGRSRSVRARGLPGTRSRTPTAALRQPTRSLRFAARS